MSLHVLSDSQLTKAILTLSVWAAESFCGACSWRLLLWSDPHGPEGVGGAGVTYYPRLPPLSVVLPSVDGAVIAAFSKVLLPLWLCIVFTAYMFGPAS